MKVKILEVLSDELVGAVIRDGKAIELPSIHNGWDFNFGSRLRELPYAKAYILVAQQSLEVTEGCLIFQMQEKTIPYMAYLEIAPHNRTDPRKYDYVAGCLIAYACKLSFTKGKGDHQGWLTFDVSEENLEKQHRLMAHYSQKYGAKRFGETTMLIEPNQGLVLIADYLERKA
jgi:hypothetical protein